jgi:hypothetical protein
MTVRQGAGGSHPRQGRRAIPLCGGVGADVPVHKLQLKALGVDRVAYNGKEGVHGPAGDDGIGGGVALQDAGFREAKNALHGFLGDGARAMMQPETHRYRRPETTLTGWRTECFTTGNSEREVTATSLLYFPNRFSRNWSREMTFFFTLRLPRGAGQGVGDPVKGTRAGPQTATLSGG